MRSLTGRVVVCVAVINATEPVLEGVADGIAVVGSGVNGASDGSSVCMTPHVT